MCNLRYCAEGQTEKVLFEALQELGHEQQAPVLFGTTAAWPTQKTSSGEAAGIRLSGYDRNLAALEFHHRDSRTKQFQLDLRSLSNRSWQVIAAEAAKCVLVCSNCHKEIHNPQASKEIISI